MSDPRKAAWDALASAAKQYAAGAESGQLVALAAHLSETAKAWGAINRVATVRASGFVVPFGRDKGKALADSSTENLEWVAEKMRASVDDPEKARFRDANLKAIEAIEAELATR